jgi:hypothetical protein
MPSRLMTLRSRFLLLMALALATTASFAQSSNSNRDPVYGFDPLLYNGKIYSYFPQPGTGGIQYLYADFDTQGALTLRGVTYSNLTLNYDIFNQKVILKYKNAIGSPSLIEVSTAWLEMFELGGSHFEIRTGTDTTKRIYQVLGSGPDKILYYQRKELLLHNQQITGLYYFSKIIREMYLQKGNRVVKFKNNHSFITVFSKPEQELIKKYLRKKKIKVTKASDSIMAELINYCNTLSGS